MAEFYVESEDFLVKIPEKIAEVAVLLEPLSIIEKGLKQAEDIQKGSTSGSRKPRVFRNGKRRTFNRSGSAPARL